MEYYSVEETAKKWGLSVRRVQVLCRQDAVKGAARLGKVWMIPREAQKPRDKRFKAGQPKQSMFEAVLSASAGQDDMLSRIMECFPYAIQVYTPDGTMVMTNEACLQQMHIPSKDELIGRFNVLTDPVIDKWGDGVRDVITRSFQGETVQFHDLQMPVNDIIDRFETDEMCFDDSFLNITCFPVFDDNARLAYVVHVFVTSKVYNGKDEIVKAKQYIENHWLEDFDLDAAARSVHLSRFHFSRIFKRYTSMTPFSYYQSVKLSKIKEQLHDGNLSIREVFSACGVDYSGNYARMFREKVGMTPTQFRKTLTR